MPEKVKSQPVDAEGVDRRLRELAREQLRLVKLEADLDAAITTTRSHFGPHIQARKARIEELARELRLACEDSRQALLPPDRKSLDLLHGTIGWRTQGDRVVLLKGVKGQDAAERLQEMGHFDLVRTRLEPDKVAIKVADLPPRTLAAAGLQLLPAGEDWYYALNLEVLDREDAA